MARTKAADLVGTEIKGFKILDWKRENKRTYLLAVCPFCNKRKWMRKDQIDNPKVVSCGCYNAKNNYIKNKDITGQTFGRLTAVRPTDRKTPSGATVWECKCSCGNTTYVGISELILGRINSCGCLRTETSRKNGEKAGKYIKDNFCIENTNVNNLTAKKPKNNTSGIKGVSWDKEREKWVAQIVFQGKTYNLGRYDKKEDAAEIRKIAEEKLYGKFLDWYNLNRCDETTFDVLRSQHASQHDMNFIDRVEWIYNKMRTKEEIAVNSSDYLFIANQKHNYKNLSKWRKNLLNDTGILNLIGNRRTYSWDEKFEYARRYYVEFGNLRVPPQYVNEDGFALGVWITNLRNIYCKNSEGRLNEERIKKLESIGIEWRINNKLTWDEWYNLAVDYYKEHGNLSIPSKYEINGYKLGNWVSNQKVAKRHPGGHRRITPEQIGKLEAIGIEWEARKRSHPSES